MKIKVFIFVLLSIIALSNQNDNFEEMLNCLKAERVGEVAGFVFDLYTHKITMTNFIEMFMKWNSQSNALMCIKNYGGERISRFAS